jgi:hypothetical protein
MAATSTNKTEPDTTSKPVDSGTNLLILAVSRPRQAKSRYAIAIANRPGKRLEYVGIQK